MQGEAFNETKKKLADAFYILADNIIKAFNFKLIDRDDALQEGVLICFEKIDRFVPEKGKAFNYMTTCCLNHYRQLYRNAKNYIEFKRKYIDFVSKKQPLILKQMEARNKIKRAEFQNYRGTSE